jgi:glycosyltransferase involved in cell wall biosynthesis
MRIAITTDWLTSFGGGERVLTHLRREFGNPPIYTSVFHPPWLPPDVRDWDVRPTVLQRLPLVRHYSRALLPLMPWAFGRLDLSAYDVVVSCSSAFSKAVRTTGSTKNVCYCFTPPRYLWDLRDEYASGRILNGPLRLALGALRHADRRAASGVDRFIAISKTVAERIRRIYGREAEVIHPPVDTCTIQPSGLAPEPFYLVVARLVRYKRIDLAVDAANRLGRPLWIVGEGPERRRLERMAGPSVRFLGWRSDRELADLYARCRAFLFPGLDDFGIAPVEAQAAGRPVVAYGQGGALETVVDGATGVHFRAQTSDSLIEALERLDGISIDAGACRRNAERFDSSVFRARIRASVEAAVDGR